MWESVAKEAADAFPYVALVECPASPTYCLSHILGCASERAPAVTRP
jgi:hypothetical protein